MTSAMESQMVSKLVSYQSVICLLNIFSFPQQEALTEDLFSDMLFTGGYNTENFDNSHHCYINQFGIYLPDDNSHDDNDDDNDPVNMPAMGTDWRYYCMEAKYRTFVTLQQMLEFAYIGAVGRPPVFPDLA